MRKIIEIQKAKIGDLSQNLDQLRAYAQETAILHHSQTALDSQVLRTSQNIEVLKTISTSRSQNLPSSGLAEIQSKKDENPMATPADSALQNAEKSTLTEATPLRTQDREKNRAKISSLNSEIQILKENAKALAQQAFV